MQVFVTGGAGFIGGHVVRALLSAGHSVTVFDSLVSGKRENLPNETAFVQGDIRDSAALEQAAIGAEAFVHLAALVSVPESVSHPEETEAVNVVGAQNVFNLAGRDGRRLVYASSAAVYGDLPDLPKKETSPLKPQSPYAASKLSNELAAEKSGNAMGLRFFNVYGAGQRADHEYASVIPRFIAAAKKKQPLPLTGDGSATRDFINVRDVANAVVCALSVSDIGVCNIASGIETSLNELITLIRTHIPVEVKQLPSRPGDILRSVADITRAKKLLHWEPTVSLEEGIAELVIQSV